LLYTRKEPTLKYSNLLEILKYFVITTKIVLSIIFFYYCVKCAVENQFGLAGMLFMLLCISFPHFNKTFALRHAEYSATASLLHSHSSQYPDSTTILQVSSLTTPEASRIEYLHPPITYEEEKNISFYYSGEYGLKHKVKIEVLYADYEEIEGLNKDNNIDTYEVKRIVSKIYDFDTKELSPVNDWIEKYNLMRC
jgi:dolichyl-phosphate-mannose--protein O-mannosyl transferase